MKKLLIGFFLLTSTSIFANECTVSMTKGANFPGFVDDHINFYELVISEEERINEKGYSLIDGIEANQEIFVSLETELNRVEGYWTLHRADAYTSYEEGRGRVIDVSSRRPFFGFSTNERLVRKVIQKAIQALPDC